MKSIKVSEKLHEYLLNKGVKSESFEKIIWRLINLKIKRKREKSK